MNHHHRTAAGLASLGRGNDKMLIHVTPEEVHGLNALVFATGGKPSINPHTGLYEYGWLSSLLPTIVGALATPFLGPAGIAIASGLTGAVASGAESGWNLKNMLMGGAMGALGGYAGAGVGKTLMGAGKNALTTTAQQAADAAAKVAPAATATAPEVAAKPLEQLAATATKENIPLQLKSLDPLPALNPQSIAPPSAMYTAKDQFMAGVKGLMSPEGRKAALTAFKELPKSQQLAAGTVGLQTLSSIGEATSGMGGGDGRGSKSVYYMTKYDPGYYNPELGAFEGRGYEPGYYTKKYPYNFDRKQIAQGGLLNSFADGGNVGYPAPPPPDALNEYMARMQAKFANPLPEARALEEKELADFKAKQAADAAAAAQAAANPPAPRPLPATITSPGMSINPATGQVQLSGPLANMSDKFTQYLRTGQNAPTGGGGKYSNIKRQIEGLRNQGWSYDTTKNMGVMAPAAPMTPKTPGVFNPFAPGASTSTGAISSYDPIAKKFIRSTPKMDPANMLRYGMGRGFAGGGGVGSLGAYSDGGQMLRGPGDGMSDSIPAMIDKQNGGQQEALLSDGEFVVPADVVSGLGNGSTDAGAQQLYAMMDRVRMARTGRKSQATEINPDKYIPS